MKVHIQAMRQDVTPEELKQHLSPEKLKQVQEQGGKLQAYVIAHEGISRPKVLDKGTSQVLKWPRKVVQKIAEKIQTGLKFFVNHGETNAHDGRKSVGEVVGSFVRTVGDKLASVVIGHFTDSALADKMDVNSMEADVKIDELNNEVIDVNELTGIALGSSDKDSPAFPGAVRLASVQCFEAPDDDDKKSPSGKQGGQEMPTFDEVKQFVASNNVWPSQLYSKEQIQQDRVFAPVFEENKTLKSENDTLKKSNEKLQNDSAEAVKQSQISTAKDRLAKALPEGLTEKQQKYIVDRFKPEGMTDLSDEAISKYIASAKDDFANVAKIFGDEGGKSKEPDDTTGDTKPAASSEVDAALNTILSEG